MLLLTDIKSDIFGNYPNDEERSAQIETDMDS